jgi:aminoglycoside phosphotransferase (APT) family kinase protein
VSPRGTVDAVTADGRAGIDADLVRALLHEQLPRWADLPVRPVEHDGHDNRTYRLGPHLSVRLPTAAGYVPAVAKEDRWLPVLAARLPLAVPEPVATGVPGCGYPFPWSVRRWITGTPLALAPRTDHERLAGELAGFVRALQAVDADGGPAAGEHSFFRGCDPVHYDGETRRALEDLAAQVDTGHAREVWDAALAATWTGPPVWFRGDLAVGNLLVRDGRLVAVIDFGTCGVGDPACDLVIALVTLRGRAREVFRAEVPGDDATWARARGWALWKALITAARGVREGAAPDPEALRVVREVLADHRAVRAPAP